MCFEVNLGLFVEWTIRQGSASSPTASPVKSVVPAIASAGPVAPADSVNIAETGNFRVAGGADITDYSPDWAYTEGGVKVLITGPWFQANRLATIKYIGHICSN